MKIKTVALCGSNIGDYLFDIVAEGMVYLLGRKNVYIKDLYIAPNDPNQDLHGGYSYTNEFLREPNEISSLFDCDVLINNYARAPGDIGEHKEAPEFKKSGKTVVIIDGGDFPNMWYHIPHDLYFKKEYYINQTYPKDVFNLPFAAKMFKYDFPNIEKTGDISLFGSLGANPLRGQLMEAFKKTSFKCNFGGHSLQYMKYLEEVRRHWLCLSTPSASWDTYRYWELPYFACPMLCSRPMIKIDNDFVDKESCLKFDTAEEAVKIAEEYLPQKEVLLKIGEKAREVSLKYNLSIHRAQKVLDEVEKL